MENSIGKNKFGKIDILMIFCTMIWGANYAAMKFVIDGINEMAMNSIRLLLSSIVMAVYILLTKQFIAIEKKDRLRFFIGSVILLAYHFSYLYGIKGTLSWKASIMMGTMPIFVTIISFYMKDEIASFIVWLGVILSFLGLIFLMKGHYSWDAFIKSEHFIGDIICLCAAILWAIYTIEMKPLLTKYSPTIITAYPLFFVALLFLPISIPHIREQNWSNIGLLKALIIFLSGLFSIAIGSIVWYASVKLAGNIRTSVYSNFTPVWAMLVSLFILKERLGALELTGSGLVLTGVALSKFKIEMPGLKKKHR